MGNGASAEAQSSLARVTKYYYHGGRRVAQRRDGVVYYLHGDHLGSVSLATDAAGGFHSRQLFRPYGDTRYQAGTLPTDFGFAGQREDGSTGLLFMHARYYHAALGRFVSADTVVPEAASSAGAGLATIGYSKDTRLTPLTVDFHEMQFVGLVGNENRELLQFGPPALWDEQTRQEHHAPMGPANPQALNRYAYCLGNPLRYIDPTGHDGWIIIHREVWGPLSRAEAEKANNDWDTIESTSQWAVVVVAGKLFKAGYIAEAFEIGIPDLLLSLSIDETYLAEGDHGVYFVAYSPDQAKYISIEYVFDGHGNILFYQQMQSWDNSNWWLISQVINWPPEEPSTP